MQCVVIARMHHASGWAAYNALCRGTVEMHDDLIIWSFLTVMFLGTHFVLHPLCFLRKSSMIAYGCINSC
jgi:hypothetical protein